jgi:hypothetical protein
MSDAKPFEGHRAAGEYLRQLLLKPGLYRNMWQQRVAHPRDTVINQLAVAEVVADYLRSSPSRPGHSQVMPYQLREVVSEALSGRQLSLESLSLFIDAFGLAEHEADRLRRLWAGTSRIRVLSGPRAVSEQVEAGVNQTYGPRLHRTLALHDHVYVAPDARIDRSRTIMVLEAMAHGVDRIPFVCDTNVLTVEVGQGGKELSGEVREMAPDTFYTVILLARTLDIGETTTLEYVTTYKYPGNPADPEEREFRRAVMRSASNLDMRVQFDPSRLPARIYWAQWDGVDGEVLECETVSLDKEFSAHRYMHSVEKTVVGFYWLWDDPSSEAADG